MKKTKRSRTRKIIGISLITLIIIVGIIVIYRILTPSIMNVNDYYLNFCRNKYNIPQNQGFTNTQCPELKNTIVYGYSPAEFQQNCINFMNKFASGIPFNVSCTPSDCSLSSNNITYPDPNSGKTITYFSGSFNCFKV